jgi:hypothetical protein
MRNRGVTQVLRMNNKILLVFLLTFFPGLLLAEDYQCTIGNLQRRIEILYEGAGSVPCEVHYYKDKEARGERQVLWRALNEEGYCESKAQEFIAKLEDMGWACEQRSNELPQPDSGASDDTGTLMPGEDMESEEDL